MRLAHFSSSAAVVSSTYVLTSCPLPTSPLRKQLGFYYNTYLYRYMSRTSAISLNLKCSRMHILHTGRQIRLEAIHVKSILHNLPKMQHPCCRLARCLRDVLRGL